MSVSTKYEPPNGSAVLVTPLSCARICCVRSARVAANSVGSAQASSSEFVCRDCVPPITAASACSAVRTTLLYGCCAVSEQPAVCAWKRSAAGARRLRSEALGHRLVPDAPRGAVFGDFLEEIVVRIEKERKARREIVHGEAAADAPLDIFDSVAQA